MCVIVISPVREIKNKAPEPGQLVGGVLSELVNYKCQGMQKIGAIQSGQFASAWTKLLTYRK